MFFRIIFFVIWVFSCTIALAAEETADNKSGTVVELVPMVNNEPVIDLTPAEQGAMAEAVSREVPVPIKSTKELVPQVGSGILTADPYSVVVGLLAVIALIFGLAWFVRKIGPGALAGGHSMRVVSVLGVGPREKVLLLDVGGHQILLGVAPGRVSHLRDFDEPVIVENSASGGEFSAKLKQLLRQNHMATKDVSSDAGHKATAPGSSDSKTLESGAGT